MAQLIKDLKVGDKVDGMFSVKYKHPPREYKNGFMFTIGLADRTGEIEATFWGRGAELENVQNLYESFQVNEVVFVKGEAGQFKNKVKINIDQEAGMIRRANMSEYKVEDFVPTTNQDVDQLFLSMKSMVQNMENAHLRELIQLFFNDQKFVSSFKRAPAAMYMHHACIGGLIEHTWEVIQICNLVANIHTSLDRDLLLAGAILHDIGKIKEFTITTNIKISEVGMLRGHISIGQEMITKKIEQIKGFPEELKMKVIHIAISHHGKREYGAIKEPQFPEAAVVYYADEMSSKITQYIRLKKDVDTEDFRVYSRHLGEIYLK